MDAHVDMLISAYVEYARFHDIKGKDMCEITVYLWL